MSETLVEEGQQTLESTTIWVNRTAATVKGGRRFSFCALVAVGDRNGSVGLGYGKAPNVPAAIEKAQKEGRKKLQKVTLNRGTLTHEITGRFLASKVRLVPASPGTGVIAGGTVRAVLELAGVRDCLSKSYGSNNKINLARATLEGLLRLRTREQIAELRGVEIDRTTVDEKIELGEKYAPTAHPEEERAKAPVNVKDEEARSSRGRGRGRGRRGGRAGERDGRGQDRRREGDDKVAPGGQASTTEAADQGQQAAEPRTQDTPPTPIEPAKAAQPEQTPGEPRQESGPEPGGGEPTKSE